MTSLLALPPPPAPQSMDRLIRSQAADHFRKLEALLAGLPQRCLVFACYCSRTLAREKAGGSGGPGGGMFPSRLGLDMLPGYDEMTGWLDRLGRGGGSKAQRKSSKVRGAALCSAAQRARRGGMGGAVPARRGLMHWCGLARLHVSWVCQRHAVWHSCSCSACSCATAPPKRVAQRSRCSALL